MTACLTRGVAMTLLFLAGLSPAQQNDLNTLFQLGRAAYYKGDLEQARDLLSQVAARQPNHFETKALLAQIQARLKPGEGSLKSRYAGVKLAKVEFSGVTLQEALDGLRVLARNASGGQVVPNFIVKDPALGAKNLSLTLSEVPLTQAIQYLAELAGARVSYDAHAVIFTGGGG